MIEYDNRQFFRLIFTLQGSVISRLMPRCLVFAAVSAVFTLVYIQAHFTWTVETAPWTIIGLALGLLLVFRTNASYDRFWEGRKLWGGLVNVCRKLVLDVTSYVDSNSPEIDALKIKAARYVIAAALLIKHRLRDEDGIEAIENLVDQGDIELLRNAANRPVLLLGMIEKIVYQFHLRGALSPHHLVILDRDIGEILNALGGCERIRYTPLPLAYVLHLKRTLSIFCMTLAFPLIPRFGWWTPFIVLFVSYAFTGIEEIGVEIEDPFGEDPNDLPVDQITDNLGKVIENIIETSVVPAENGVLAK